MTIADGRDGAYGMTFKRVPLSNDLPSALLDGLKTALYINDNSFDDKLIGLITDAIHDFERLAAYSIFPQTINVYFEYFKGKNKLPFAPHDTLFPVTGYTTTGTTTLFLDGGDGSALNLSYTAGSETIPEDISRLLVKMAEFRFKNELLDYPMGIYSQIRSFTNWID